MKNKNLTGYCAIGETLLSHMYPNLILYLKKIIMQNYPQKKSRGHITSTKEEHR